MASTRQPPRPAPVRTPEQILLANERKAKKLAAEAQNTDSPLMLPERGHILVRSWLRLRAPNPARRTVKVMTWNMLAQSLVRRELFPGSDCLKVKDREQMLSREILQYKADIVCLQEVDRLSSLLPSLQGIYSHIYACGPSKLHGCMILYRRGLFREVATQVLNYDEEELREDLESASGRRASTRRTRNIGLLVALQFDDGSSLSSQTAGCIVATTHLFWHPRYTYERARQSAILVRGLLRFRSDNNRSGWPCILAGDFNSQPTESTYSLLVGDPLTSLQDEELEESRVIHVSLDPTIAPPVPVPAVHGTDSGEKGGEEEDGDPDCVITNSRGAMPSDGLFDPSSLQSVFRSIYRKPIRSAYDEVQRGINSVRNTFGARQTVVVGRKGAFEPMWTSFTPLWRLTLDYIFIMEGENESNEMKPIEISAVLDTHKTDELEPGLPRKGICASDHIALAAEFQI